MRAPLRREKASRVTLRSHARGLTGVQSRSDKRPQLPHQFFPILLISVCRRRKLNLARRQNQRIPPPTTFRRIEHRESRPFFRVRLYIFGPTFEHATLP